MKENEIIEKYLAKNKNNDICKEYNISRYTLSKILKKNNIPFKQIQHFLDENFFENIDTEEKAYWLGFLYADGYVRKRKNSSRSEKTELKLKLSTKDKSHLEKFKISIKSNSNIHDGIDKNIEYSYIGIYNKKIVDDLILHGCVNRKSLIIKFPKLNKDLERHFIRGYFDGDGCISVTEKYKQLNFVSGSIDFIKSLKNIFVEKLNVFNCKLIENKKNCYYIAWSRLNDIKTIYNYFYKDSNIFLERKKNKFDQLIEKYKEPNIPYRNYKLYIFKGDKNIIIVSNNLNYVYDEINKKILELNISEDGVINEYKLNEINSIVL